MNLTQWKTAGRYGYRRDLIREELSWRWEKFWLCRVRRIHRIKFTSDGRCIRCNKQVR